MVRSTLVPVYVRFAIALGAVALWLNSLTISIAPPGPMNLQGQPAKASAMLTWTQVPDTDRYYFQRQLLGGSFAPWTSVTDSFGYVLYDTMVTNGQLYFYRAQACNSIGCGPYSPTVAVRVTLDAPRGLSMDWAGSYYLLSWQQVPDADGYRVYRSTTPGDVSNGTYQAYLTLQSKAYTSCNAGAPPAGTVYYYYVVAYNRAAEGMASETLSTSGSVYLNKTGAYRPVVPSDGRGDCFDPYGDAPCGKPIFGPQSADPVATNTGEEMYMPMADLYAYNPHGPAAKFQRYFSSLNSMCGRRSPGLAMGWTHGYDAFLQGSLKSGSWGSLEFVHTDGGHETLTPVLSGGLPTGAFTTGGMPYLVVGTPSTPSGHWSSVSVTFTSGVKWVFAPADHERYLLSQIVNPLGHGLSFQWDSSRRLTTVKDIDDGLALLALSYGSNDLLASVTDRYGRSVYYGYDVQIGTGAGEQVLSAVSEVVPTGTANSTARESYAYVNQLVHPLLSAITVPSPTGSGTATATINYSSSNGKVASLVDATGAQRTYTYNTNSTLVKALDAQGVEVTRYTSNYDSQGRDTGFTDALGHSAVKTYGDPNHPYLPTSMVDRMNRQTTFTYDGFGNLTSVTNPRGVTATLTYNYSICPLGLVTSVQRGSLPATTMTYTSQGLIQSVTSPAPGGTGTVTTSVVYNALGNVVSETGPGNDSASSRTITYNYTDDGAYSQNAAIGQPLTITDELGSVWHFRYDDQGRITQSTTPLGATTTCAYTLAGQMDTVWSPATGQTGAGCGRTEFGYVKQGGAVGTIDSYDESGALVQSQTFAYGPEGELVAEGGDQLAQTFGYDAAHRLTSRTDGLGRTTTYGYSAIGTLASVTAPGGRVTQITSIDNDGAPLTRVDPAGIVTNYEYNDAEGLPTAYRHPADPSQDMTFMYDGYGRLINMTNQAGQLGLAYGTNDEVISESTQYAGMPAISAAHFYYPDGSRSGLVTPYGNFAYHYDAGGRLTSMVNPFAESTSWTYDADGGLSGQISANGQSLALTYDADGETQGLTYALSGQTLVSYGGFQYDGLGNQTNRNVSTPSYSQFSGSVANSYDAQGRVTGSLGTLAGGWNQGFGFDLVGNLTNVRGSSIGYDVADQLTGSGYAYDADGRPTTYGGACATFDLDGGLVGYDGVQTAYRPDGLRASRISGGAPTYYLYDGGVPLAEIAQDGSLQALNTFGADGLVSRRSGGQSVYYAFDPRGDCAVRTDAARNVLSMHVSDPFGLTASTGGAGDPFVGMGAQLGNQYDGAVGLYVSGERFYDPAVGRFLTRDPIGQLGGSNEYAFAFGNPMSLQDPFGLDPGDDVGPYKTLNNMTADGYSQGGIGGAAKVFVGTAGIGILNMLGGRAVASLARASGTDYGCGDLLGALGYGALAFGEIALEAASWGKFGEISFASKGVRAFSAPKVENPFASTEFSHWLPKRWGVPMRNPLSGQVMPRMEHGYIDTYSWRFLAGDVKRDVGRKIRISGKAVWVTPWPVWRRLSRNMPPLWKGSVGALAGSGMQALNPCRDTCE